MLVRPVIRNLARTALHRAMQRERGGFSVLSFFAAGEQGVWYDPSDFSTMYQDSAGTTPVTAVEQPVGLMLDKSKGLVLGTELVTNGGFDSDTGWTLTSTVISGGKAVITSLASGAIAARQSDSLVAGKTYIATFTIGTLTAGDGLSIWLGGATGLQRNSAGTYSEYIICGATNTETRIIGRGVAATTATIDNISVKELPGNHLIQATSASRPVLSARVNLLTYSEQFDNAAWIVVVDVSPTVAITANAAVAPDGTTTADKIAENTTTAGQTHQLYQSITASSEAKVYSIYAKAAERSWMRIQLGGGTGYAYFDIANGIVGTTNTIAASITSAGNGWYLCTITYTSAAGGSNASIFTAPADNIVSYAGTVGSGFYIWGAQVVSGAAQKYQRIAAATSYDTVGFPYYLKFDGIDDSMATGSINFTSTDKMTVFAGVRKLSDAAVGYILETSPAYDLNAGAFVLRSASGGYTTGLASSIPTPRIGTTSGSAAPITNVVTSLLDASTIVDASRIAARVDGVQKSLVYGGTAAVAPNSFGSYPLYIGRRGGATLPFNGHLYGLIIRGAQSSDSQIASAESYVNSKTGAY